MIPIQPPLPSAAVDGSSDWRNRQIERWHVPVLVFFLLILIANAAIRILDLGPSVAATWLNQLILPATALTCLTGLARRLPVQNVAMVGAMLAGLGWAAGCLEAGTGLPFGPLRFGDTFGFRLLGGVPWPYPFLWIAVVIIGRGVARLILRPYRKATYYGFWVIGLATLLAVTFDFCLEPFASGAGGWWRWDTSRFTGTWHGAPWVNFLGWLVTHGLLLAFVTPWLINKQPVKQPMDFHPLSVWIALHALVLLGNGAQGHWSAVGAGILVAGITSGFALRGAREINSH